MATQLRHPENRVRVRATPPAIGVAGSGLLVVGGAAGIVLGIFGLMDVVPAALDGVGVIVLGCLLVLAGTLLTKASEEANIPYAPGVDARFGGFTSEFILGLIAVVLGILAVAGVSTINLVALGVMALGGALWMGSLDVEQFDRAVPQPDIEAQNEIDKSWSVDVVLGMVAVVLGILAWMGVAPRPLTLIANIGVGLAMLFLGSVLIRKASRNPDRS